MTLATTTNRVDVLGNGSATSFSFIPVTIFTAADLQVTLRDASGNETLLTLGAGSTNYSVQVTAYPGTGSITYPATGGTPIPLGSKLIIKRIVSLTQGIHLESQGAYLPAVQETGFDYLTAQNQQQQEQLNRTIQFSGTDVASPAVLPSSAVRANKLLGFDGSGNPMATALTNGSVAVSTAMTPVVTAASTSIGAAALGISSAMQPVVAAASKAAGLIAASTPVLGDFGTPGFGVSCTGAPNGIIGQVTNNLAPGTLAFPTGVTGYASVTTAGNIGFGMFARADLSTVATPGVAVNEFNSFNFAGTPSGFLPPLNSFGTTEYCAMAAQVAAYGNFPSLIGMAVMAGSQPFQYGLYVHPQACNTYALMIDADATHGAAVGGAVIRSTNSVPNLILQTQGASVGANSVFTVLTGAGTTQCSINQSGDFNNAGFGVQANGILSFKTAVVAATATTGANGALPAQVVGYIPISVNGTARKIPFYAT